MLPAAQGPEPSDVVAIMDGEVAAIALAEHGAFGMGWPQLAALRDGLTVGTDQPLPHIEAAAVAFGHADDRGQLGALHSLANYFGLRTVESQRVIEIALHEAAADRPSGSSKPDLPRISGDEGLRQRNQLRALRGGLLDQVDRLV